MQTQEDFDQLLAERQAIFLFPFLNIVSAP